MILLISCRVGKDKIHALPKVIRVMLWLKPCFICHNAMEWFFSDDDDGVFVAV